MSGDLWICCASPSFTTMKPSGRIFAPVCLHASIGYCVAKLRMASAVTQNRPTRMRLGDVESDARHGSLRRYEQRLERREKKQQVIALGRLGWPLWRIEQETGVRRGTAGAYLKAAGIGVRPPEEWGRRAPAKAANAMAIGQDLVSESGFRGGYKTVKRFVRKLRGHQPLQAHAVIIIEPEKIKISAASW